MTGEPSLGFSESLWSLWAASVGYDGFQDAFVFLAPVRGCERACKGCGVLLVLVGGCWWSWWRFLPCCIGWGSAGRVVRVVRFPIGEG